MQPPIESRTVNTNNVLLKITIPRRRKKKIRNASSNGSDSSGNTTDWDQKTVLDKLRASKGNFKIEAVGMIERTVRFRGTICYLEM
jgi:general transcription factor 3C polypeptide 5 (transcription factor C subunit 1)